MSGALYDADLLVVGGGPAGLAAALCALRAGMTVVVCEPRGNPVDKACGEGIMPAGMRRLAALGVRPVGAALTGIDYTDLAGRRVHAPFRNGHGRGVRRTVLHDALSTAAAAAGATWNSTRVRHVTQDPAGVTAGGVRARWLIAADGLHSAVRRGLGIRVRGARTRRFGLRQHWEVEPWTTSVEVTWGRHAEAYVTPVAADQIGVALLYGTQRAQAAPRDPYATLVDQFPLLAERLKGARPLSSVRGAGPMPLRPVRRVQGRALLVGDAAGYEDALTGEGVSLALAQAEAAVEAIVDRAPARYEKDWLRITRRYRMLTRSLVGVTAVGPARGLILPSCSAAPWLFRSLVDQLGS